MTDIDKTLGERGSRYGEFEDHALITQLLKAVMQGKSDFIEGLLKKDRIIDKFLEIAHKWDQLSPAHKEALEMIAHKIGRILNGDPNYDDSWHDIAGYAKLGEDACELPSRIIYNPEEHSVKTHTGLTIPIVCSQE